MTHAERLTEIQNNYGILPGSVTLHLSEIHYLLSRVQTLTQAIELALNESSWPLAKGILRKALESEE